MLRSRYKHRSAVVSVLLFCFSATTSWSQSCVYQFVETFETYGSSNGTLYSSVSVVDNSGCNHSGYQTTAHITLPNGQSSQSPAQGGLQATVSIVPSDPGPSGTGFVTVSPSTSGTFYCPVYHGTAGFGGGQPVTMPWASVFGLPNDGQNMVFTQSDFNYLVSQNILPAAAGTVVLVTQPELYL